MELDLPDRQGLDSGNRKLTVLLPADVLRQLRTRMAENDTTMRALVLEALALSGYRVDATEIRDRRRHDLKGVAGR
jgi:hypothetical protein